MKKISILFFLIISSLLLQSCITLLTDLGVSALGYSPSLIDKNMQTLDPNAKYSKRASIFLTLLGDEEKMKKLSGMASGVVDNVLSSSRDTTDVITVNTPECDIVCYLVFPKDKQKGRKYPVILYAHGGGFELFSFKEYGEYCCTLADKTDSCVLFYEYRKAPKYKFPKGVNDTFNIYTWLMDDANADKYCLDNDNFALAGDSSGGNFASGLMLRIAEESLKAPKAVLLLYPSVDVGAELNYSRLVFSGLDDKKKYNFTSFEYLISVQNKYLEKPEDAYKPYASPLVMLKGLIEVDGYENPYKQYSAKLTPPLNNFPPHLICVPEIDTLRDEGKMYYAALRILSAPAELVEYKGMFHGFAVMNIALNQAVECMEKSAKFLKKNLYASKI